MERRSPIVDTSLRLLGWRGPQSEPPRYYHPPQDEGRYAWQNYWLDQGLRLMRMLGQLPPSSEEFQQRRDSLIPEEGYNLDRRKQELVNHLQLMSIMSPEQYSPRPYEPEYDPKLDEGNVWEAGMSDPQRRWS